MRNLFKKFKKPTLLILGILVLLLIFSQTSLGKRFLLESSLIDAIRNFFLGNPELHACDYKEGEIILIKPVATGVGDGRYEAGDIVEIRDGAETCKNIGNVDPLGTDEKTKLLPLYYPGKLTEEQKRELTEPEYTSSTNDKGETRQDMQKRRKSGLDYTQLLSDREILKVRSSKSLNKLPEIDLSYIIKKSPEQRSVVKLPQYLTQIESIKNSLNNLARKIIPITLAGTGGTKTICPAGQGCNYNTLNGWESGEQGVLSEPAIARIQGDWSVATDTTAVTISSWTTTADNYIYIYTTPEARHNGKWDTGKYKLEINGNTVVIYVGTGVGANNIRIEGLQMHNYTSGANHGILFYIPGGGMADFRVSDNIIRGVSGDTNDNSQGISLYDSGSAVSKIRIWNNLIYDFPGTIGDYDYNSGTGINLSDDNFTVYIYNNTIYGCYNGFTAFSLASKILKNNLFYSNTYKNYYDYYSEGYGAGTTNNLSGPIQTDAPGTDPRNGVTVLFANASTTGMERDLHLVSTDTGAKNYGTSTANDSNLSFTDDIDGQTRSGSWDIGADEYQATPIYRSVGPGNTTALASSTGQALVISGSTATFSSELASNIGVGDVIVYNSSGTTTQNTLAFIHARTSNSQYTVKDKYGKTPLSATSSYNWQVFRAYTTLYAATYGAENNGLPDNLENFDDWIPGGGIDDSDGGRNLASSTEQWNIACYGDAVETSTVYISGWRTAADNYLKMYTPYLSTEVGVSQRHSGKWDTTKYRIEINDSDAVIYPREGLENFRIEGLQMYNTYADSGKGIEIYVTTGGVADMRISDNIIRGITSNTGHHGIAISDGGVAGSILRIWNNIIYGFGGTNDGDYNSGCAISSSDNDFTYYIYNNTFYGNYIGNIKFYLNNQILKNNISYSNTYKNYYDYGSYGYGGGTTNNLSGPNQTDAPGTNPKNGVTVQFVDETNKDFHLSPSDIWAKDNGTNLSADSNLAFSTDIDGENRPVGWQWDIGADESRGATQINTPITGRGPQNGLVGHWTFNGEDMNWASTTAEALDRSSNNNNGNVTNFGREGVTEGKVGQALNFDGSDDYVTVSNANLSSNFPGKYGVITEDATFCAWIKYRDSVPDTQGMLFLNVFDTFSFEISWNSNPDQFHIYLHEDTSTGGSSDSWIGITDFTGITSWRHICFTFDGSTSLGKAWISSTANFGDVIDSTSHVFTNVDNIGGLYDWAPFQISAQNGANDPFDGVIDEVRIYNRALSADEIGELYRFGAAKLQINTPAGGQTSGLVGHWTFDGQDTNWDSSATGTTDDKSGNNNTGTMTNMSRTSSPVPGISGQALSFDGNDDYVNATSLNPQISGNISISMWVNWKGASSESDTGRLTLLNKWESDDIWLNLNGDWVWDSKFHVYFGDLSNPGYHTSNSTLNLNQWYHLVAMWDGTNVNLYINGVLDKQASSSGSVVLDTSDFKIGKREDNVPGSQFTFNGLIDEVRIYNRALSLDEVQELYRAGARTAEFRKY